MESGQHTFRVPLRARLQDAGPFTIQKVHHSRKAHNKSRGGCDGCKQRRKKCDERRPRCSFCIKRDIACNYIAKSGSSEGREVGDTPRHVALASNPRGLWPGARAPLVLTETAGSSHTEFDLYLLDHFLQTTAWSFGLKSYGQIYATQVLPLAQEFPFLMHALIALSACHLQYLGIETREYKIAETLHCNYASHGLRNSISSIEGAKKSDSILTAAMMLNTLTFCLAAHRDQLDSVDQQPRYDWLRIQIGMTGLLSKTSPFHPDSIWLFVFSATHAFEYEEPPESDLDVRIAEFCGVHETSTSENNVYFDLVERLGPVVVRPPGEKYMVIYLYAVGGISSRIVDLLEAKDTKALLLWAHWLGMMCSVDLWWSVRRTRRECWMVCAILAEKLDLSSIDLLRRPAEACGFPIDSRLIEWDGTLALQ